MGEIRNAFKGKCSSFAFDLLSASWFPHVRMSRGMALRAFIIPLPRSTDDNKYGLRNHVEQTGRCEVHIVQQARHTLFSVFDSPQKVTRQHGDDSGPGRIFLGFFDHGFERRKVLSVSRKTVE